MGRADFRPYIPSPGQSRIAGATPAEHTANRTRSGRAQELLKGWSELSERPFTGIGAEGVVRAELFALEPQAAPAGVMATAERNLPDWMSSGLGWFSLPGEDQHVCGASLQTDLQLARYTYRTQEPVDLFLATQRLVHLDTLQPL